MSYDELRAQCRAVGHQLLGVRRCHQSELNPADDMRVNKGVQLITIGPSRLRF